MPISEKITNAYRNIIESHDCEGCDYCLYGHGNPYWCSTTGYKYKDITRFLRDYEQIKGNYPIVKVFVKENNIFSIDIQNHTFEQEMERLNYILNEENIDIETLQWYLTK